MREQLEASGDDGRRCLKDFKLNEESGSSWRGELRFISFFGSGRGFDCGGSFVQENSEGRFSLCCLGEIDGIGSLGRDCVERAPLGSV